MAREYFHTKDGPQPVSRDGYIGYGASLVHVGPAYPKLGAEVEKFRRAARRGELSKDERRAYGDAVGAAIRALQRRELLGSPTVTPTVHCASGTNHNDKEKLDKALRAQLHGYQSRIHSWNASEFGRRPWQDIYEATMAGKNVGHSINQSRR